MIRALGWDKPIDHLAAVIFDEAVLKPNDIVAVWGTYNAIDILHGRSRMGDDRVSQMSIRSVARIISVLALAACGGGDRRVPDGGGDSVDAAIDAPPDAPAKRATVIIYNDRVPLADLQVLFQRPDDSLVADVKTDQQGRAQAEFPTGGNVTVLVPTFSLNGGPITKAAFVILGVMPDDVLEVGAPPPLPATPVRDVTLRLASVVGDYRLQARCGGRITGGEPALLTVTPCASPSNFAVLNPDNELLYTDDLTFGDGQTIDLTGGAFQRRRRFTMQVMNADSGPLSQVTVRATLEDRGFVLDRADGFINPAGGAGSTSLAIHDLPNVTKVQTMAFAPFRSGALTILRRGPLADPAVFDFAKANVPFVGAYRYANNTVSWNEQGAGVADLSRATLLFSQPGPTTPVPRLRVVVFGPHQGTSLRIPTFPAPYADYDAIVGDIAEILQGGIARLPGGWDAARRFAHHNDFLDIDWLDGELITSDALFF